MVLDRKDIKGDKRMRRKYSLVILFLILTIFFSGCLGVKVLSADVVIEHWYQSYDTELEEWGDTVQVWFTIYNTGNKVINYYKVWFTAYCVDGSSYEDWVDGAFVFVGQWKFRTCLVDVGENKEIVSVEVTNWELEFWGYPVYR